MQKYENSNKVTIKDIYMIKITKCDTKMGNIKQVSIEYIPSIVVNIISFNSDNNPWGRCHFSHFRDKETNMDIK